MGALPGGEPQNLVQALANSSWTGAVGYSAKGNDPANLKIVLQSGNLTGMLSYDGFEETLAITVSAPSTIQMKGVSYRDLQREGRSFNLDVLNGELSKDGATISGSGTDSQGTRSRFEFHRMR